MQLIFTNIFFSLPFLPLIAASGVCTSSGSISWPPVGDCSLPPKFDTVVENCRSCCMNNADCFQVCLKAAGLDKRNVSGDQLLGVIPEKRELKSRVETLTCTVNVGCYKFTDGSLLCLNLGTGLYHDDVGGNGDYYSGVYTGPDGKIQTGTSTATATSLNGLSSTTTQMARSSTPAQTTPATAASASVSSAAASALSPANGDVLYLGANVGLVGFVAGLVL